MLALLIFLFDGITHLLRKWWDIERMYSWWQKSCHLTCPKRLAISINPRIIGIDDQHIHDHRYPELDDLT